MRVVVECRARASTVAPSSRNYQSKYHVEEEVNHLFEEPFLDRAETPRPRTGDLLGEDLS